MKSEQNSRRSASQSRTNPMAPPAGSGEPSEVIYGLHAVREALRSGARPLVRLLVVRQDRQFADLIRLARSAGIPVHLQPRPVLDRLVPDGRHQGVVGPAAAERDAGPKESLGYARGGGGPPVLVILDRGGEPAHPLAGLRAREAGR